MAIQEAERTVLDNGIEFGSLVSNQHMGFDLRGRIRHTMDNRLVSNCFEGFGPNLQVFLQNGVKVGLNKPNLDSIPDDASSSSSLWFGESWRLEGTKERLSIKPRIPQPCPWTVLLGQRENRLAQHTRAGCSGEPVHGLYWLYIHIIHGNWIGLRENLQEAMVFTIKYGGFL